LTTKTHTIAANAPHRHRTALAGSKLRGLAGWLVDGLFSFASESVASALEDDDFCVVD
jgi:hypothetical protein